MSTRRHLWRDCKGPVLWALPFLSVALWSAIAPTDRLTWLLDAAPALGCALVLALLLPYFRLTPVVSILLLWLCLIILTGAHYGFGKVPAFDLLRDWYGGTRNGFDKFAHFFQGLVPALALRELLVRIVRLQSRWLAPIAAGLALSVSAFYELIEWLAALLLGTDADAFIGAQGDPWDAQSDMAMALAGAVIGLALFSTLHDKQLRAGTRAPEHI